MGKFSYLVSYLLNLGSDKVDPDYRGYVKQANFNGLLYFVLDLLLALLFNYVLDDMHISQGLIVSSLSFLICSVGFNSLGWTTLSRLSTVSIGSFLVVYCALYVGSESFTAASLLLGAIFPFVYFSIEEKKSIGFCLAVPVACYAFLAATNYHFGPSISISSAVTLAWLRTIFFALPFLGIVANTYTAVSEREQKTRNLKESQKLLETIFFALSHDLANPMQTITMIAQSGEQKGAIPIDRIKKLQLGAQQMMRVFNNLKSIAQTSMDGKIKLRLNEHFVSELIDDAVKFLQGQAQNKSIRVETDLNQIGSDLQVLVDKDVFVFQILTNFLTNAIKFSEPNQLIRITARVLPGDQVQIVIRDWGQGIEAGRLKKLFLWSERTTTKGTQGEIGTGLGLPLATKFLKAMNGEIQMQSKHFSESDQQSRGTQITLSLPICRSLPIQKSAA